MLPFGIVRVWVLGIGALLQIVAAIDYLWAWHSSEPTRHRFLVQGTVMLVASFAVPLAGAVFGRRRFQRQSQISRGEILFVDRPDGVRLAVEVCGPHEAPTIVLTHGWGLDSTVWPDEFVEHLAERWRVVRWDLSGFGRSTWGSRSDVSVETLACDLDAVLERVGGDSMLLVGHSFGGMLLQTHARLFPERMARQVAGLVIIDATYTNPTHTARNHRALACIERPIVRPMLHLARHVSSFVRLVNTAAYLNGSLHLATRLAMFGKSPPWATLDHLVRLLIRTPMRVVVPVMFAMFDHDETETLPQITVPVLLVVGGRDRWTPPACHEFMASRIPHAKLEIVAGAGHLPFLELPERVATSIDTFLAECRMPPISVAAQPKTTVTR